MKLASPISQTSWKGGKRLHENCFQVEQCAGISLSLVCVGRIVVEGQGRLMGLSELLWTRFLGLYIPQCAFYTDLYLANKLCFRLDAKLTVLI